MKFHSSNKIFHLFREQKRNNLVMPHIKGNAIFILQRLKIVSRNAYSNLFIR